MAVFFHEIKMNMKNLLIWSVSIMVMGVLFMLIYPLMKDSLGDLGEQFSQMGGLSAAFGMDKLSIMTPMGYYGTQVGVLLVLGGGMYAALLGAGLLSKEESGHTAEFMFTAGYSRLWIVGEKVLAMVVLITVYEIICIVPIMLTFKLIGEPLEMNMFGLYQLAQYILHLETGFLCLALSAFMRKANVGLGIGLSLMLYFLDMMSRTVKDLSWLKYLTPYTYANAADVMVEKALDGTLMVIACGVMLVSVIIAFGWYRRKDLQP